LAAIAGVTGAQAQTAAPAPTATPAANAAHYSTSSTEIGALLDDPAAKALLDKYIPGMTGNPQVDMARAMTLKDIQQYSPDLITDKVLTDLDAEFAKIPAKPTK
jgi:para-nitrobenzyl esterase